MTVPNPSYIAQGDIRPSRFVKQSLTNDFSVVEADANDQILGISWEGTEQAPIPSVSTALAASSGKPLRVYGLTEVCRLELGGTVEPGDELKSDADGKGVVIAAGTTTQNVGARALEGGASGEKIRVQVTIYPAGQTAASS